MKLWRQRQRCWWESICTWSPQIQRAFWEIYITYNTLLPSVQESGHVAHERTDGRWHGAQTSASVFLLFVHLLEPRCDCVAVNGDFMPDTTELHAQKIINYSKLSELWYVGWLELTDSWRDRSSRYCRCLCMSRTWSELKLRISFWMTVSICLGFNRVIPGHSNN